MRPAATCLAAIASWVWVTAAFAQHDPATVDRLLEEGRDRSQVMTTLQGILQHGTRLTGSTGLDRAELWVMDQLEELGLEVRREQWGSYPMGFDRGPSTLRVLVPYERELVFTSPAWGAGTDGPVAGPLLLRPETVEAVTVAYRGAWVLMPFNEGGGPRRWQRDAIDDKLDEAGIAGRVWGGNNDLIMTSGNFRVSPDALPTQPQIVVGLTDFRTFQWRLTRGFDVELEANMPHTWIEGPVPTYNVIAEIPGTEKPDEYVILSAHLDSWDGPGTQGACDNALGVAVAMEAARILIETGAQPKRTILLGIWSGEEQGLYGSRAFVQMHLDKMPRVTAVLNEDAGPNWHRGLVGEPQMMPWVERAVAPLATAFPGMEMVPIEAETLWSQGSSDHAPFTWVGVPALSRPKEGPHNYRRIWHTAFDRLEEVNPDAARQMATNTAIIAYILASHEELVPRLRSFRSMEADSSAIPGFPPEAASER